MAKSKRRKINLKCPDCKNENYTTKKNPQNTEGKLKLKKYCRYCRTHTEHKETKPGKNKK